MAKKKWKKQKRKNIRWPAVVAGYITKHQLTLEEYLNELNEK